MLTMPYRRRRAQNRESQRAYRSRKDSHIRNLESRLSEVKGKYDTLAADYERCKTEFEHCKKQVDDGLRENEGLKGSLSPAPSYFDGRDDLEQRSMDHSLDEDGFDELSEFVGFEGDSEHVQIP